MIWPFTLLIFEISCITRSVLPLFHLEVYTQKFSHSEISMYFSPLPMKVRFRRHQCKIWDFPNAIATATLDTNQRSQVIHIYTII